MTVSFRIIIGFSLLILILGRATVMAQEKEPSLEVYSEIDPIINRVIDSARTYESTVTEYHADLYIKTTFEVYSRNILFRLVPMMFRPKKGVSHYIAESYSDLHYTAPNIYDQKVNAAVGTLPNFCSPEGITLEYFHINIYETTLLYSKLISPLADNARKYYKYELDSTFYDANGIVHYKVSYKPKNSSFQLVKGDMIISGNTWSIREFFFSGRSEFFVFSNRMKMGELGSDTELLPLEYDANIYMNFIGNKVDANYAVKLNYDTILTEKKEIHENKYDLSHSYTLSTDTCSYIVDYEKFKEYRCLKLTDEEKQIYLNYFSDSTAVPKKEIKKNRTFWGDFGDLLISSNSFRLEQYGNIKFSALLNPLMLRYSRTNGLAYKQTIKYNHLFSGDRLLRVVPRFGYNFKQKEFYWSIDSEFEYWPRKRGTIHMDVGKGNPIYASAALREFSEMPDSIFDINAFDLKYYKDFYFDIYHSLEIVNGLTVDVGIVGHRRKPVRKGTKQEDLVEGAVLTQVNSANEELDEKIQKTYISCAPRISISWTPGQYYYMSGKRKINIHGNFPTIIFDYERGIKGFMNSTGGYEKIELDIQQYIPLSYMKNISYRVGGGKFTNQEQQFFVDFSRFTKHNLPVGWKDEIGGVFQLLDSRWYNASRHYVRGHLTYESPFLLLRHLIKETRFVLNERLYLNVLGMKHMNPYLEVGYGIGTHIFDLGLFVSSTNWKKFKFGFEITFELFSR